MYIGDVTTSLATIKSCPKLMKGVSRKENAGGAELCFLPQYGNYLFRTQEGWDADSPYRRDVHHWLRNILQQFETYFG